MNPNRRTALKILATAPLTLLSPKIALSSPNPTSTPETFLTPLNRLTLKDWCRSHLPPEAYNPSRDDDPNNLWYLAYELKKYTSTTEYLSQLWATHSERILSHFAHIPYQLISTQPYYDHTAILELLILILDGEPNPPNDCDPQLSLDDLTYFLEHDFLPEKPPTSGDKKYRSVYCLWTSLADHGITTYSYLKTLTQDIQPRPLRPHECKITLIRDNLYRVKGLKFLPLNAKNVQQWMSYHLPPPFRDANDEDIVLTDILVNDLQHEPFNMLHLGHLTFTYRWYEVRLHKDNSVAYHVYINDPKQPKYLNHHGLIRQAMVYDASNYWTPAFFDK